MAQSNPYQKRPPAGTPAQTPEQIKDEVGYLPEEDITNLGEEPANFLPDEPIPKKVAAFQQQQDDAPDENAGLPEFLSYSAQAKQKQKSDYQKQYGGKLPRQEQPKEVESFEEALGGGAEGQGGEGTEGEEQEQFEQEEQAPEEGAEESEGAAGRRGGGAETEEQYEEAVPEGEEEYQPAAQYSARSAGVHKIATTAVEGLRRELEAKIDALDDEIANLKRMEANVAKMSEAIAGFDGKYAELSRKAAQLPEKTENEIESIKSSVDALNALLAKALPALIKEVRSLKGPNN